MFEYNYFNIIEIGKRSCLYFIECQTPQLPICYSLGFMQYLKSESGYRSIRCAYQKGSIGETNFSNKKCEALVRWKKPKLEPIVFSLAILQIYVIIFGFHYI